MKREETEGKFLRDAALAYGFCEQDGAYRFERRLFKGEFRLVAVYAPEEGLRTELIDVLTGEPYVLHLVAEAQGAFVGQLREEYDAALSEIEARCFERTGFGERGTAQLMAYAAARYGDAPEYLWEDEPSIAVLRRQDTQAWYAVFFRLDAKKLSLPREGEVELVNVRALPEKVDALVADSARFLRGYHMNKRRWLSVLLDGSVPQEMLHALLDESYCLAQGKTRKKKGEGRA